MITALPQVTVSLVDNSDGTHGVSVSINHTADLLLAMTMLARAMVSVCGRASEVAASQEPAGEDEAADERLIVLPDRRILRG